jgi:FAD/FMN-containing dehydrogenase
VAVDSAPGRVASDLTNGFAWPDRRMVLAGGAALGAGALCRPFGLRAGPSPADWRALRRRLSTHALSLPGESSYRKARELFDPRFDRLMPAGIAYCGGHADVSACLAFATKFRLPVRARAGGHSYAGWSSVTGGLVIDVSRINQFTAGSGTVIVGAGMDLITLYGHLAALGLAVPGGSCPTVGLAGLALGGGVGVLSRQLGLTCDNIQSLRIVTADGSVLTCDSTHHSDLFWACRGGGGGNFGIVTSFTLMTHPLRRLVRFFLQWPWSRASAVVGAWQSWAPTAPDALWSNMHLSAAFGGAPQLSVGGTYLGTLAGARRLLGHLYSKVGSAPSLAIAETRSFLDVMLIEAGCLPTTSVRMCKTQASRVPFFAKSDFFTTRLSASGIAVLVDGIERLAGIAGASGGAGSIAFDAFGGAVNKVAADATAFVHRDALFLAQYYTGWNSPGSPAGVARQHQWLRSYYVDLHPHASGQAYQNYIDPDLSNWRQAYYGANYPRLSAVKAKYDPAGLFTFPQAITA